MNERETAEMERVLGQLRGLGCRFEVVSHRLETIPTGIGAVVLLHVRCSMSERTSVVELEFNITDFDCW